MKWRPQSARTSASLSPSCTPARLSPCTSTPCRGSAAAWASPTRRPCRRRRAQYAPPASSERARRAPIAPRGDRRSRAARLAGAPRPARTRPAARPRRSARGRAGAAALSAALSSSGSTRSSKSCAHRSSPSSSFASWIRALRVRVFTVPSGRPDERRDLALREVAPVEELDHAALPFGQLLRSPGGRATASTSLSARASGPSSSDGSSGGSRDRRLARRAAAVDDRVPRDGVEPGRADAALGPVGARRAPDRRERVLHRVLGPARVAEAAHRQAEDGSRVPAVERLEGRLVARAGALDQLPVRDHADVLAGGHQPSPDPGALRLRDQAAAPASPPLERARRRACRPASAATRRRSAAPCASAMSSGVWSFQPTQLSSAPRSRSSSAVSRCPP